MSRGRTTLFPHPTGYTTAAWTGIATTATTLLVILALHRGVQHAN